MNRQRVVLFALFLGCLAVLAVYLQLAPAASPVQAEAATASAGPAPVAKTAVASPSPGWHRQPSGSNAYGFDNISDSLVTVDVSNSTVLNFIAFYGGNNLFVGADFLPGNDQTLYAIEALSPTLYAVNTFSGQLTAIGPLATSSQNEFWTGMAADPTTGLMYASTGELQCSSFSVSTIYTLNLSTAQATPVGPVSVGPCIIGIAFDGQGQLYGLDIVNDELIKINKNTGAATVLGPIGFDANFSQGMDYDEATGTMYLAAYDGFNFSSELRTADLTTGNTTFVDFLGSGFDEELGTIAFGSLYTPTVVTNIDPLTGGRLVYADPQGIRTTIDVPPNAVTETTSLFFNPVRDPGFIPGFTYANRAFDLSVGQEFAFLPVVVHNSSPAVGAQALPQSWVAAPAGTGPGGPSFTFLQPVTMTIEYSDADIGLIQDENSLRLYYQEAASGRWLDAVNTCPQPGGYTSDPATNTVQLKVCHLTRFGLVGN